MINDRIFVFTYILSPFRSFAGAHELRLFNSRIHLGSRMNIHTRTGANEPISVRGEWERDSDGDTIAEWIRMKISIKP